MLENAICVITICEIDTPKWANTSRKGITWHLYNVFEEFILFIVEACRLKTSMPEAGPPPGLFTSYLYSVIVHFASDVKLFHLSLGTKHFITWWGGEGVYVQASRKQYLISLYVKIK